MLKTDFILLSLNSENSSLKKNVSFQSPLTHVDLKPDPSVQVFEPSQHAFWNLEFLKLQHSAAVLMLVKSDEWSVKAGKSSF